MKRLVLILLTIVLTFGSVVSQEVKDTTEKAKPVEKEPVAIKVTGNKVVGKNDSDSSKASGQNKDAKKVEKDPVAKKVTENKVAGKNDSNSSKQTSGQKPNAKNAEQESKKKGVIQGPEQEQNAIILKTLSSDVYMMKGELKITFSKGTKFVYQDSAHIQYFLNGKLCDVEKAESFVFYTQIDTLDELHKVPETLDSFLIAERKDYAKDKPHDLLIRKNYKSGDVSDIEVYLQNQLNPILNDTTECDMDTFLNAVCVCKSNGVACVYDMQLGSPADNNIVTRILYVLRADKAVLLCFICGVFLLIAAIVVVVMWFLRKRKSGKESVKDESKKNGENDQESVVELGKNKTVENTDVDNKNKPAEEQIRLTNEKIDKLESENNQKDEEIKELKVKVELHMKEIEKVKADKDTEWQKKIGEKDYEIEKLNKTISSHKDDVKNAKADKDAEWQNKFDKLKIEFDEKNADLAKKYKDAKEKVKTIKTETEKSFEQQIATLKQEKDDAIKKQKDTKKLYDDTDRELNVTKSNLSDAKDKIAELKGAQEKYTSKILFVPYAMKFCGKINELFVVENNILDSADKLLKTKNISDPYYLTKHVSNFMLSCSKMNRSLYEMESVMAMEQGLSLKGHGISRIDDGGKPGDREKLLRVYFLNAFLDKYINALMVLNENLAGLYITIPELNAKDTQIFTGYRKNILNICNELNINVLSAKVADVVGNNIDLKAELFDFDENIPSDTILEVKNCIVYDKLANKPNDKIMVIAQK